jgi:O-antigen ligase
MSEVAIRNRASSLLLLLGPLTSLAISPFSNFDPINLIKLLIVVSFAGALLALMVSSSVRTCFSNYPIFLSVTLAFLVWMVLSLKVSQSPSNQQFWGVFGRSTGFLTYTSLVVIAFATAMVSIKSFYHKLIDALVLTSVPMTIYALAQIAGKDPISWSEMAPFATLGNINFSSAFFGLAALCSLVLAIDVKNGIFLRFALISLVMVQMLVVLETGSIQGFMIFIAGAGVALFLWLRSSTRMRMLELPYVFLGFLGFIGVIAALFNVGPFARFIFQNTILFRFDYWYAGWMMTLNNPIFGVGLDSYGDWYRELRGEVATLRTGPDRITNTAHNVYLDISASGGFPLLLFYLLILGLALRASLIVIRRQKEFNPYFTALFSAWVAYLIQAGVSINQIGVGIWGWLFTGALIGYELVTRDEPKKGKVTERSTPTKPSSQLPASAALLGIAGFGLGFALAFVPLNADANFKNSLQTGVIRDQFVASKALGATAFHMELALDAAIKANDELLATEITNELLQRYPRDFMAWRVKQVLASSTPEERELAYQRLKAMDPYNPDIQRIN